MNEIVRLRADFWKSCAATLFSAGVFQFVLACLVPIMTATLEVSNGAPQTVEVNINAAYALWLGSVLTSLAAFGCFSRAVHYLGKVVHDPTGQELCPDVNDQQGAEFAVRG